jgi:hypothetical protein
VDAKVDAIKTAINGGATSVTEFDKTTETTSNNMGGYFQKINTDITSNMTDAAGTVTDKSGSMNSDVTEANTSINKDTARQWDEIRLSVDTSFASIYSGSMEWVKKLRDDLYDRFDAIAITLPKKFKGIDSNIAEHFENVTSSVETAVNPNELESMFQRISDNAVNAFNDTASNIANQFRNIRENIASQFSGLSDIIYNAINPDALLRMAETAAQNLTSPFESARTQIENAFRNLNFFDTFEMYNLGQRAGEQLAAGFRNTYIQTPHMYISGWDQHPNGNGGTLVTPQFSVQWYAKGGFPRTGQMFVANENGIEAMGRMNNRNVVANNQQIVDGIKAGVIDALHTVLMSMDKFTTRFDLSNESLYEFTRLNDTLTQLSQYAAPLVSQGRVLPSSLQSMQSLSSDLSDIIESLQDQGDNKISYDELRMLLIDIARNYISSNFYIGDEQLARHVNNGNTKLGRIYGNSNLIFGN